MTASIFKEQLKLNLEKCNTSECSLKDFPDFCLLVLNRFLPLKRNICENQTSFIYE